MCDDIDRVDPSITGGLTALVLEQHSGGKFDRFILLHLQVSSSKWR